MTKFIKVLQFLLPLFLNRHSHDPVPIVFKEFLLLKGFKLPENVNFKLNMSPIIDSKFDYVIC